MLFPLPATRLKFRNLQDSNIDSFANMNLDKMAMEFFPSVYSKGETIKSVVRIRNRFNTNGFGLYALEKMDDGPLSALRDLLFHSLKVSLLPVWKFAGD